MSFFGNFFSKPRLTPEASYELCRKEQPTPEWKEQETITWAIIREITFDVESSMARATLLVPRGDRCVEFPCISYFKFVKIGGVWRVAAEPSIGLMGTNKLYRGTLTLEPGDAVEIAPTKDSLLSESEFPRTPDGWATVMTGKYLPYREYRIGQVYYFKGPWS